MMRPADQFQLLYCCYCGKECHSLNSLRSHEVRCKQNPEHITNYGNHTKGRISWSKGLTKDTNEILKNKALQLKAYYQTHPGNQKGRPRTSEEKQKISQGMKNCGRCGGYKQGSGRGKKGHYKGLYCDSTYELVWTVYCLDHDIKFKRCLKTYTYSYKGETHKYHPDYELEDGSLIEIKGYHNEVVDLKTTSVTDVSIKVLYKKDLKEMFNYVKENYSYKQLTDLYD